MASVYEMGRACRDVNWRKLRRRLFLTVAGVLTAYLVAYLAWLLVPDHVGGRVVSTSHGWFWVPAAEVLCDDGYTRMYYGDVGYVDDRTTVCRRAHPTSTPAESKGALVR